MVDPGKAPLFRYVLLNSLCLVTSCIVPFLKRNCHTAISYHKNYTPNHFLVCLPESQLSENMVYQMRTTLFSILSTPELADICNVKVHQRYALRRLAERLVGRALCLKRRHLTIRARTETHNFMGVIPPACY